MNEGIPLVVGEMAAEEEEVDARGVGESCPATDGPLETAAVALLLKPEWDKTEEEGIGG